MELPVLIREFTILVEKAKDPSTINDFMKWVEYHAKDYLTSANVNEIDEHDDKYHEHADDILDQIAADLRSQVPLEAQLESENIVFPTTGQVDYFHFILCKAYVYNIYRTYSEFRLRSSDDGTCGRVPLR